MERPYRIIVTICLFVTISLIGLMAMHNDRTALNLAFMGLVVFTLLSGCYGTFYYFLKKKDVPYKDILVFSACLTAFLFTMDYMVWDKNPPNPPARQIVFESIVVGTFYTGLFFGVISGVWFGLSRTYQFVQKRVFARKSI
jgi:hypothetical protein